MDWLLAFLGSSDFYQGLIISLFGAAMALPYASDSIRHSISQMIFRKKRILAANNEIVKSLEQTLINYEGNCEHIFESLRLHTSKKFKVKAHKLISKDDALILVLEKLNVPAYNNTLPQRRLIERIVHQLSPDEQLTYEYLCLDHCDIPNLTARAINLDEDNDDFISENESNVDKKIDGEHYADIQLSSEDFNSTTTYHVEPIWHIVLPTLLLALLFGIFVGCISFYLPLISVVQIVICMFTFFTIFKLLRLIIGSKTDEIIIVEDYTKRLHFEVSKLLSLVFLLMISALLPKP